jgi:hypothetical protein
MMYVITRVAVDQLRLLSGFKVDGCGALIIFDAECESVVAGLEVIIYMSIEGVLLEVDVVSCSVAASASSILSKAALLLGCPPFQMKHRMVYL